MDQTDSTSGRVHVLPIRQTGDRRPGRTDQTYRYRRVSRGRELLATASRFQEIKHQRRSPGTDRHIRENDVYRVTKPRSMQNVFDFLSAASAAGEGGVKQLLQAFFSRLKPILTSDSGNDSVGSHTKPPWGRPLRSLTDPKCSRVAAQRVINRCLDGVREWGVGRMFIATNGLTHVTCVVSAEIRCRTLGSERAYRWTSSSVSRSARVRRSCCRRCSAHEATMKVST